jgi:hypothetical protein
MSRSQLISSASTNPTYSFLAEWSERKLSSYVDEYGGQRAGVPKGDDIPFPPHKVQAAVALLAYGAPKFETLTAVARTVRVSGALLRVWRTEDRFLALYRRAVWECADDYLHLLGKSWEDNRPSPSEEFQNNFGAVLQRAILQRLLVNAIHALSVWEPPTAKAKWLSEWSLISPPPPYQPPSFFDDAMGLLKGNASILLSSALLRLGTREPAFEQWACMMTMHDFTVENYIKTDLQAEAKKYGCQEVLSSIKFLTSQPAIDRYLKLFRLLKQEKRGRRS